MTGGARERTLDTNVGMVTFGAKVGWSCSSAGTAPDAGRRSLTTKSPPWSRASLGCTLAMRTHIVSCDNSAVISNRAVLRQLSSEEISDDSRNHLRMLEQ